MKIASPTAALRALVARFTSRLSRPSPTARRWPLAVPTSALGAALAVSGATHAAPSHAGHGHARLVRTSAPQEHEGAATAASAAPPSSRRDHLAAWLRPRLPSGGALAKDARGELAVIHTVRAKADTWASIAEDYLDLTDVYDEADLAKAIANANPEAAKLGLRTGTELRIPHIVEAPYKTGDGQRLGLPADKVVKGIYVRGDTAGKRTFPALLDKVVAHGMNAIVLDVKDYDGPLTYPSKVPLAIESGAVKKPPIRDYARAVRFAHAKGVRVIARVSCFEDELMSKKHPSMSVRGRLGGPYGNGWLDPKNEAAQNYVIALAKEAIDNGVDEVQLDYVRYPVTGVKNADFGLDKSNPKAKVEVITNFVERVHGVTKARGVPLSLDVFGVIAFGRRADIDRLGQDPPELAKHAEFLSAMVYPSHYDEGFMGWTSPGDHPEIVGKGVKHMIETIEDGGVTGGAKIRPWLQAMAHKSSNYGPWYIQQEMKTSDDAGGRGWLLWNPGQEYDVSWRATPKATKTETAKAEHGGHRGHGHMAAPSQVEPSPALHPTSFRTSPGRSSTRPHHRHPRST